MTQSEYAAQQLRVIRSLMERATIYRAVSATTAFAGGLLSLAGLGFSYLQDQAGRPLTPGSFRVLWLLILALTSLFNIAVLWRGAAQRQEPFFSPGMRCALGSLMPAFLTAGVGTLLTRHPMQLALAWITLYGLGLLATRTIAPRSLVVLGAAFLVSGCALLSCWKHLFAVAGREPTALIVSGIMAATFGGYHLIYAAAVWALQENRAPAPEPPLIGCEHV